MKALIVDPDPVNRYGTDLCNALSRHGTDVTLLTARGYRYATDAEFPYCAVAPQSSHGRRVIKAAQEAHYLAALGSRSMFRRPDVLHVQWWRLPIEIHVFRLLAAVGIPLVWTAHNVLPRHAGERDASFYRGLYSIPDAVIAHTDASRRILTQTFAIPDERVHLVRPGIFGGQRESSLTMVGARSALGLPSEGTVFLFYGQLRPYKGWEDLVRAFEAVVRDGADAWLIIAGRAETSSYVELRDGIRALGPAARRRVMLRVEENDFIDHETTRLVFTAADCVTLPYREITFSAVMLQAFAYDKPVLASDLPGLAESIEVGVTGYMFPAGDVKALANGIHEVMADARGRRDSRGMVRSAALEKHDWARAAAQTADVYRSISGGRI